MLVGCDTVPRARTRMHLAQIGQSRINHADASASVEALVFAFSGAEVGVNGQ